MLAKGELTQGGYGTTIYNVGLEKDTSLGLFQIVGTSGEKLSFTGWPESEYPNYLIPYINSYKDIKVKVNSNDSSKLDVQVCASQWGTTLEFTVGIRDYTVKGWYTPDGIPLKPST
ncbi:MAG: hypothetical protein Q4F54_05105 [Coriobacteriia bacterium]|nr:hypothetical protein [Coriobacteriia bacterium]